VALCGRGTLVDAMPLACGGTLVDAVTLGRGRSLIDAVPWPVERPGPGPTATRALALVHA
jgi:hypothetical protein